MDKGNDDATVLRVDSGSAPPPLRAHDRFTPGTLVAGRFRIIALLGHGGMGEVYRADDVKLGQQVALKFLPEALEHDRERLQRLYSEVRVGRQVSHPNVCRLYDIVEWQGSHFIAMEYIDGEDLGSLLRRIGKLPADKALELMHEICAGLAAAHSLGIVHRDLKPANIMIDGRGRARVTDFGLAAAETDSAARREAAGTLAYMAPEQIRGGTATQKSDLYALGLVFFEMFTGKRYEPKTSSQSGSQTKDLDPVVQRVLARCLDPDPDSRPSIHAVIAGLPGADPLQAALDAGETPSPEMVAAAGVTGELRPSHALPLLILAIALLLAAIAVKERTRLSSVVPLPLTPDALEQRAHDIAATLGAPVGRYTQTMFFTDDSYRAERSVEQARTIRPAPLRFSWRSSPREMVPEGDERLAGRFDDPPFIVPGMARVQLDPAGRLVSFATVPPQHVGRVLNPSTFNWNPVLAAAGFDPARMQPATPEWSSPVDTDAKFAWTGAYPDQPSVPMRVEAASYRGKPVSFTVIPPWQKPQSGEARPVPALVLWGGRALAVATFGLLAATAILARRNVQRGRADRAGGRRAAVAIGVLSFVGRLVRSYHSPDPANELGLIIEALFAACFYAVVSWAMYTAVEPYLRRRWPRTLVGWSRLMAARAGDPMVGRDLLFGTIAGGVLALAHGLMFLYLGQPVMYFASSLAHTRHALYAVFLSVVSASTYALLIGVALLVGHLLLRSRIAAVALAFAVFLFTTDTPGVNAPFELLARAVMSAIVVLAFVRLGVLAATCAMVVAYLIAFAPLTLDPSAWLFGRSLLLIGVLLALVGYGFYRSLGTQPLFAAPVLDD